MNCAPQKFRLMLIVLISGLLLFGCAQRRADRTGEEAHSGLLARKDLKAAETFDAVWSIIAETHWDTNYGGVNWEAVREELRPRAVAVNSHWKLVQVLQEMLERLDQSHMRILSAERGGAKDHAEPGATGDSTAPDRSQDNPQADGSNRRDKATASNPARGSSKGTMPDIESRTASAARVEDSLEQSDHGSVGIEIRPIDGQFVVVRVEPGGSADEAGVRPGWLIERLDGTSLAALLEGTASEASNPHAFLDAWAVADGLSRGTVGTTCACVFLDGEERLVDLELERRPPQGEPVKLGNMPTLIAHAEWDRLPTTPGGAIGWIRFNVWMLPLSKQLDAAIEELGDVEGLIVDLRGNLGGVAMMTTGFAGHFLDRRTSLGTMKMRDVELEFRVNPRRATSSGRPVQPSSGPLAILVDGMSASTSEMFAGGLQSLGRARVFGERTAGQVLPAMIDRLPNGDQLMHAVADFLTPDGVRLEGRGVVPDQVEPMTRRDLLDGRDPALEAAIRWIARGDAPSTNPSPITNP